MNKVELVYFINLDHREDRLEQFGTEMEKMEYPFNNIRRISAAYTPGFGCLGCGYSHINALQSFLSSGADSCIIFEDDFTFRETKEVVDSMFEKVFKEDIDFDLIMLSGNILYSVPSEYIFLEKVIEAQTTSGYWITKKFAPKLLAIFEEAVKNMEKDREEFLIIEEYSRKNYYYNAIDIYWKKLQVESKWFIFLPSIGYQSKSYSDIQLKITDYKL